MSDNQSQKIELTDELAQQLIRTVLEQMAQEGMDIANPDDVEGLSFSISTTPPEGFQDGYEDAEPLSLVTDENSCPQETAPTCVLSSTPPTSHPERPIHLKLPLSREDLVSLSIGDDVRLSGPVFTMRDAGHQRALDFLNDTGKLPYGLEGQTLFYAGPTPAAAGRPLGSVGPTTASRMDFATPQLMEAGIVATIGKGKRSPAIADICRQTGGVYFAAVGGVAALLASAVESSSLVAWEDLGTEALRKLELKDFPVFVAIDAQGNDLYRSVEEGCSSS